MGEKERSVLFLDQILTLLADSNIAEFLVIVEVRGAFVAIPNITSAELSRTRNCSGGAEGMRRFIDYNRDGVRRFGFGNCDREYGDKWITSDYVFGFGID